MSRTRTASTRVRTLNGEVRAAETRLVRGVHNDAEISNESGRVLLGGQEEVDVAVEGDCQHERSFKAFRSWKITSRKSWVQSYFHACQKDLQPRTCPALQGYT